MDHRQATQPVPKGQLRAPSPSPRQTSPDPATSSPLLPLQRTAGNQAVESLLRSKTAAEPRTFRFKIRVNRDMDAAELTYEFVRQYYGFTTEEQIQGKLSLWTNRSGRGTTPREV